MNIDFTVDSLSMLRGSQRNCVSLLTGKSFEVSDLHHHSWILLKLFLVSRQKVPVKRGNWAGIFPDRFTWVESAALAVVAHATDVLTARRIRFARHQAAICCLAHTNRVG